MDVKKLLIPIITVTVAVIMLATVLIPVVDDAQKSGGDVKVFSNVGRFSDVVEYSTDITDMTISISTNPQKLTVNGVENTNISAGVVFISDYVAIYSNGPTFNIYSTWLTASGVRTIISATITIVSGTLSANIQYGGDSSGPLVSQSREWTPSFIAVQSPGGESIGVNISNYKPYVRDASDVVLAGQYYTADLDTEYYVENSNVQLLKINDSHPDYTGAVSYTMNDVSGTFGQLKTLNNIQMTISSDSASESFTPYWAIVPKEISVTTESGSMYSLYGTIPILIIVALLVGLIGIVAFKKRE